MCLTLLQELKGRLYFEDYSYSNCVNSISLLNFVYLVFFFSIYKYKSRDLATYIFTTWPLQLYVYIVYKIKLL